MSRYPRLTAIAGLMLLLNTSAEAGAGLPASLPLHFNLIPPEIAERGGVKAEDCPRVTQLQILPTFSAGWLALLKETALGLCDINIFPNPRVYRLTRDERLPPLRFTGTSDDGRTLVIQLTSTQPLQVTETLPDGKTRELVSQNMLLLDVAPGRYALRSVADPRVTADLCVAQDLFESRQPLAWFTDTACETSRPTRLYQMQPVVPPNETAAKNAQETVKQGNNTADYLGYWVTAAGAYQLHLRLKHDSITLDDIREITPEGRTQVWRIDLAPVPTRDESGADQQ